MAEAESTGCLVQPRISKSGEGLTMQLTVNYYSAFVSTPRGATWSASGV